ncbi:hypothetical protein GCM10023151_17900 [Kangiella marina]|uniref:Uncharacterized protein n=2 Tax=Kangiella marina TaxID=1079178 RepID=A0ABP8IM78_9GAMM
MDRGKLVFLGQDTENQIFSVFCLGIILWACYGIYRVYHPTFKPLAEAEEIPTDLIIKQYSSKYGVLGKTIFLLLAVLSTVLFPTMIYMMATGQTEDHMPPLETLLFSIIFVTVMLWSTISTLKAAFYQYTVTIDPLLNVLIHERSFLFWSTSATYSFDDVQYVIPSPRKFMNRYVAFQVSYGGKHNKTYMYYIYIKPYNTSPILFLESKSWLEVEEKAQELASLLGCKTYTLPFNKWISTYW